MASSSTRNGTTRAGGAKCSVSCSRERFRRVLKSQHVVFPKAKNAVDALRIADAELVDPALQPAWLEWLLDSLAPTPQVAGAVRQRWDVADLPLVAFAPFAAFCVRTMLFFEILTRGKHIVDRETNLIDLRYLYYLPMCRVFVSDDKMHRAMAPLLAPGDRFIPLSVFRADLKALVEVGGGEHFLFLGDALDALKKHHATTPTSVIGKIETSWGWDPNRELTSSMPREEVQAILERKFPQLFSKNRRDEGDSDEQSR